MPKNEDSAHLISQVLSVALTQSYHLTFSKHKPLTRLHCAWHVASEQKREPYKFPPLSENSKALEKLQSEPRPTTKPTLPTKREAPSANGDRAPAGTQGGFAGQLEERRLQEKAGHESQEKARRELLDIAIRESLERARRESREKARRKFREKAVAESLERARLKSQEKFERELQESRKYQEQLRREVQLLGKHLYSNPGNGNWIDIVYDSSYTNEVSKRTPDAGDTASSNFKESSKIAGLLEQKNFAPIEAFEFLINSDVSPAVANGLLEGWQKENHTVTRSEIDLVLRTLSLAKAAPTQEPTPLSRELAELVPEVRFASRDPSLSAISFYNEHWMKAVEAGITQQQVNEIDADVLPAVLQEKKAIAASGKRPPKIKWPVKGVKLERVYADTSLGNAHLAKRREQNRKASSAWRAKHKL